MSLMPIIIINKRTEINTAVEQWEALPKFEINLLT